MWGGGTGGPLAVELPEQCADPLGVVRADRRPIAAPGRPAAAVLPDDGFERGLVGGHGRAEREELSLVGWADLWRTGRCEGTGALRGRCESTTER